MGQGSNSRRPTSTELDPPPMPPPAPNSATSWGPSVQKQSLWRVLHIQTTKTGMKHHSGIRSTSLYLSCYLLNRLAFCVAVMFPSLRWTLFSLPSPTLNTHIRKARVFQNSPHPFRLLFGFFMSQARGQLFQCPLNILCTVPIGMFPFQPGAARARPPSLGSS